MGLLMGWQELLAWRQAMYRNMKVEHGDDSDRAGHSNAAAERNFSELDRERQKLRGRA